MSPERCANRRNLQCGISARPKPTVQLVPNDFGIGRRKISRTLCCLGSSGIAGGPTSLRHEFDDLILESREDLKGERLDRG
jgi:hypothetical protein